MAVVDVQGLAYTYPGAAAPTVSGLTFAIEPGEVFGFLGPSGAGKSTTQKVLIGLLRGYRGAVTVFGRELASWGADYYERVGVSFELPNHFLKLTGRENLAYFAALYGRPTRRPEEVLAAVGLVDAADVPAGQYSKGMKGRLSVARSLLHDPELLFLDEPTSGLDPVSARRVEELVRAQRAAGKTVFLTTHAMAVADALCDRVAFVVDGRIALIDAPRALKLRYGRRAVRVEHAVGQGLAVREFELDGLAENAAFHELLRGGTVQTIHTLEATLEDVFVRVTGRDLGAPGEAE
jgi:fluoroquinolone transport system ATP-binding protein